MQESPPKELVALLERLGLASAAQVAGVSRRASRLTGDLPQFDSVWLDALAQARILTPFQVAELSAGRGQSLRIGPLVLCQRLPYPCYVSSYRARNVDSAKFVRLAVVENPGPQADAILKQMESLAARMERANGFEADGEEVKDGDSEEVKFEARNSTRTLTLSQRERGQSEFPAGCCSPLAPVLSPLTLVGSDGRRLFAAAPWIDGRAAAEWMVHHGRFPPEVVLEIARAMLAGLVELEKSGICHGDVSLASLLLTDAGKAVLVLPGLRGILRPEEGYAHADLPPEAFDGLSPERIAAGTPPNAASDIYACGCAWWQMLCGRPPLAGGTGLAKLRAVQTDEICDVRRHALDVPAALAAAISACVEREPSRRPNSMARLAAMLGSPTRNGKEALADYLARAGRPAIRWTTTVRKVRRSSRAPLGLAAAICLLAAMVAVCWPGLRGQRSELGGQGAEDGAKPQAALIPHPSFPISHLSSLIHPSPLAPAAYQQPVRPADDLLRLPTNSCRRETLPDYNRGAFAGGTNSANDPLVLAAGKPLQLASLELRAGQCVRAAKGRRAVVLVPIAGLVVDKDNVHFENIDFLWNHAADVDPSNNGQLAVVQLRAGRATFRGCSFQCGLVRGQVQHPKSALQNPKFSALPPSSVEPRPSAVRWVHPGQTDEEETSLPSGRIELADCLLYRVGAGIDCRTVGALGIELSNTLCLGAGPLVRLDHCPRPDEPASLGVSQVTLRGGGPLLECRILRPEDQPGEITVLATACVFAPAQGEPLVRFGGTAMPEHLLGALRWTGQGSLVTPEAPISVWRGADGRSQTVDESSLSIAGLVRGEVRFAGQPSSDPAASRILYWQAPLQSASPPGIDPGSMPKISGIWALPVLGAEP